LPAEILNQFNVSQILQNSSAVRITVMVDLLGSKNFLQANIISGNLVPRFHHFLHLWAGRHCRRNNVTYEIECGLCQAEGVYMLGRLPGTCSQEGANILAIMRGVKKALS
jgi:hypothetical protein